MKRRHRLRSPRSLEEFARFCMAACEQAATEVEALVMVDDPPNPGVLVQEQEVGGDDVLDAWIREVFSTPRRFAAMAARADWAPNASLPTLPSWSLVCVDPHLPALFLVGDLTRPVGPGWHVIEPRHAAWFQASTAGAIRHWFAGVFSPLRHGDDPRLLGQVRAGDPPPVHEDGLL